MHRSVLVLSAAAFALAACDSAPTAPPSTAAVPSLARNAEPGQPDGRPAHEHKTYPFIVITTNPCPPVPEPVYVEGKTQYNAHFKFVDGGNNARLKSTSHGTGIGLVTGTPYVFQELQTTYGKYTLANDRFETEQTTRYHVISKGPMDNFFATVKMKFVFTTGQVSIEVVSVESDCRG